MFGSSVLEVAIGLVFIYLFVSLIVTAANEMIANFLNSRGKSLWKGISAMLETATHVKQIVGPPSSIAPNTLGPQNKMESRGSVLNRVFNTVRAKLAPAPTAIHQEKLWTNKLYEHPMIRALFPLEAQGSEAVSGPKGLGPSYIPPRSFAIALLDITGIWDHKIKELQSELQTALEAIPPATGTGGQIMRAIESIRTEIGTTSEGAGIGKDLDMLVSKLSEKLPDLSKQRELLNKIVSRFAGSRELGQLRTTVANLSKNFSRDALAQVISQIPDQGSDVEPLRDDLEDLLNLVDRDQSAFAVALDSAKAFTGSIASRCVRQRIEALDISDLRQALLALFEEAQGDVEKLKTNVESWFEDSMDRVSGWYKRKSVWLNFGTGAIIAICLNVDTILILRHLSTDNTMREALVKEAEGIVQKPRGAESTSLKPFSGVVVDPGKPAAATSEQSSQQPIAGAESDLLAAKISNLALPIGWKAPGGALLVDRPKAQMEFQVRPDWQSLLKFENGEWMKLWNTVSFHIAGWLFTALAASLGAPFWFDLLNKFMNIRAAGKSPAEKAKN